MKEKVRAVIKQDEFYYWAVLFSMGLLVSACQVKPYATKTTGTPKDSIEVKTVFSSDKKITDLYAGASHFCVLNEKNETTCWGSGFNGELGSSSISLGTRGVQSPAKVDLPLGEFLTQLFLDQQFTCGISNSEKLYCWGRNSGNRLLSKTGQTRVQVPHLVELPMGVRVKKIIANQNDRICVRAEDNLKKATTLCWGNFFQKTVTQEVLPDGSRREAEKWTNKLHAVPFQIQAGPVAGDAHYFPEMGGGFTHAIFLPNDNCVQFGPHVKCLKNKTIDLRDVDELVQSKTLACAITNDRDRIECFRDGHESYEIGLPKAIMGIKQLSITDRTKCLISDNDDLFCSGSLGKSTSVFEPMSFLKQTPKKVACSIDKTCALLDDQSVVCWGNTGLTTTL